MGDSSLQGKRTQFSSCDACRRSRVACDAAKFGHQPGKARWRGSCSRCSQKKKSCTFEWMNDLRKKPPVIRREARSTVRSAGLTPSDSCDSPDLPVDRDDALLESWSSQIFQQGFETVFGLSVGRNSCPFVDDPLCDVCVPATKLFGALDACIDEEVGQDSLCTPEGRTPEAQGEKEERNGEIDKSLRLAIRAYTARWLPLVPGRDPAQPVQDEERIRDTWRVARREMLKVINRASYRSILTLCLFAQTPMPSGISAEEELDGLSGLVCLQTALLQIQRLRERQKKCQFRGSEASPWRSAAISSVPSPDRTEAFLSLESRAYWAAVVWDTSSSLTSNFRASLTSGLKGACEESVWRLSRAFLLGSWNPKAEQWLAKGFEVTDDTASQVFSAAAVCGVYMWKCITSLKEALIEGVDEEGVLFAWSSLQEGLEIFRSTLCPLLCLCERQIHFLDQLRRMSWYQINMKYYLGVLIMLDILEAAGRQDLLKQVEDIRMEVEHESFNILKFGMESTYTIHGPEDGQGTSIAPDGGLDGSALVITTSLIAVDPCPHHVVDYVALMHTALIDKYRRGKIKYEAYSYLAATLSKALDQLPKHSKSVEVALQTLRESFQRPGRISIPS